MIGSLDMVSIQWEGRGSRMIGSYPIGRPSDLLASGKIEEHWSIHDVNLVGLDRQVLWGSLG